MLLDSLGRPNPKKKPPAGQEVRRITLLESLDRETWLKLPLLAMREVGPATQTLAGLLKVTSTQTFVCVQEIADNARMPVATVKKHLVALQREGWIHNKGRERTERGRLRRTATIILTKYARDNLRPYGVLPWWACGYCGLDKRKLSWAAKVVLSLVMARLMSLKAVAESQDGNGTDADDLIGSIDCLDGDERFRMSLRWIQEQTNLTRETIAGGKWELNRAGLIRVSGGRDKSGANMKDCLVPNYDARIVVTSIGNGRCYLNIEVTP